MMIPTIKVVIQQHSIPLPLALFSLSSLSLSQKSRSLLHSLLLSDYRSGATKLTDPTTNRSLTTIVGVNQGGCGEGSFSSTNSFQHRLRPTIGGRFSRPFLSSSRRLAQSRLPYFFMLDDNLRSRNLYVVTQAVHVEKTQLPYPPNTTPVKT